MNKLSSKILLVIAGLAFIIGGYFLGRYDASNREASIYRSQTLATKINTPQPNETRFRLWSERRCDRRGGTGVYATHGAWGIQVYMGCELIMPNPNGSVSNKGAGIYAVTGTSNTIVDNYNGTCSVTFEDGAQRNGISLYGVWNDNFGYIPTPPEDGIFIACDTNDYSVPVTSELSETMAR